MAASDIDDTLFEAKKGFAIMALEAKIEDIEDGIATLFKERVRVEGMIELARRAATDDALLFILEGGDNGETYH